MEAVILFVERGGDIIYPIMLVVFLLWVYLFERIFYLRFVHPFRAWESGVEWRKRRDKTSWWARQIRQDLQTQLEMGLQAGFPVIRMLISLCPLLGLLGTVTGMIEVFDVMVQMGAGSPQAMASGISKAILSTVAGMTGAISGLLSQSILLKVAERERRKISAILSF
ncbi:MAG: MotA/TolQ/ExbB proton channel family protein [Pseudomonadota bacterium]|nr:MotA/TolQ/ExbB proton channel family protein [Pseudomonadota bacterium]